MHLPSWYMLRMGTCIYPHVYIYIYYVSVCMWAICILYIEGMRINRCGIYARKHIVMYKCIQRCTYLKTLGRILQARWTPGHTAAIRGFQGEHLVMTSCIYMVTKLAQMHAPCQRSSAWRSYHIFFLHWKQSIFSWFHFVCKRIVSAMMTLVALLSLHVPAAMTLVALLSLHVSAAMTLVALLSLHVSAAMTLVALLSLHVP